MKCATFQISATAAIEPAAGNLPKPGEKFGIAENDIDE